MLEKSSKGGEVILSARVWIVIMATGLLLAACNPMTLDPKIDAATRAGFDDLRRADPAFDSFAGPELKTPEARTQFSQFRAYVANRPLHGRKTVGWNLVEQPQGEETVDVSDEYDFGDLMVLWSTHLHRASSAAAWEIQGLHWNSATVRELAANKFTLIGKSPLQYLFLLATALSPVLMIAALVRVIRAKGLRRKWLWGIAAFAGLFSFQMNWATGQIFPNLFTVQLLGAGAVRGASAFAAWVLTMTLPIGAVLILTRVWANPDKAAKRPPKIAAAPMP